MKSFEKFQYDTSPYTIDEEVEELDEDLVGMVKQGIKATGNVLTRGSEKLGNVGGAVRKGITSGTSAVSKSLQNRGVLPKPQPVAKRRNIASKEFRNEDGTVNREKYDAAGKNRQKQKPDPTSTRRYQPGQQRTGSPDREKLATQKSTPSQTPIKRGGNLVRNIADTSGTTKAFPGVFDKKTYQGGIRSAAARNVASIGNQIYKGLTAKPEQRISYDAKGTGFGGPTMGVGKNIQQAATNVGDAKLYKPTKVDSKTGRVTKGKSDQTVKDRFGLTNLANTGKPSKKDLKKQITMDKQAKEILARSKVGTEVTSDNLNKASEVPSEKKKTRKQNKSIKKDPQSNKIQKEIEGQTGTKIRKFNDDKPVSRTDIGDDATRNIVQNTFKNVESGQRIDQNNVFSKDKKNKKKKNKNKFEITRSRTDVEPQMDVKKYGKGSNLVKPKKTKDGYPAGDDATHWLDAQKQHSSKTPKLFEQFLSEIDTKSIKKKKKDGRGMHPHDEIKPMSGTNTITINPEDESSKYKRGY